MKTLLKAIGLALGIIAPVCAASGPAGSFIINVSTNQLAPAFSVASGTINGQLSLNGPGNGVIALTIAGNTYDAVSSSVTPTAGQYAIWTSTNWTVGSSAVSGGGSGGTSVYPATNTASFPFGLTASTFTLFAPTPANFSQISLTNTSLTWQWFINGDYNSLLTWGDASAGMSINSGFTTSTLGSPITTHGSFISADTGAGGALTAPGIVDLWSTSGQPNYISFNEHSVSNNGTIGFPAGGGPLIFYTGSETFGSGTERMRISPTAGLVVSSSETIQGSSALTISPSGSFPANAGIQGQFNIVSPPAGSNASTSTLTMTLTNQVFQNDAMSDISTGAGSFKISFATSTTSANSNKDLIQMNSPTTSVDGLAPTIAVNGSLFGLNQSIIPLLNVYNNSSQYVATFSSQSTISAPTAPYILDISTIAHIGFQGVSVATVTSCGTLPTLVGNDTAGTISTSGSVTGCTLTFGKAYTNTPVCTESDSSTSVTADITSISNTAVTFGFSSSLGSGKIWYICFGSD